MSLLPRPRRLYAYGALLLLLAFLGVFLIWPMVLTVRGGFRAADGGFTWEHLVGLFEDPVVMAGLINSLKIAACTTVLCLLIGLPLAFISARHDFPFKLLFTGLIMVPMILPPFVGAIGLRSLLGRFGALNTALTEIGLLEPNQPGIDFLGGAVGGRFWAVVVMEALHLYPILYLNAVAALSNVDPSLEHAAASLGAGRWRRLRKITLPLMLPGLFAGATIVFIWSFTELGTPLMFDYYTVTPVQIFWGVMEVEDNPRAFALVVLMLAVALLLYGLARAAFGGRGYEMQTKATIAATTTRLRAVPALLAIVFFGGVSALAMVPHAGVVLTSLTAPGTWYQSVLPQTWTMTHYGGALTHDLAMGSIRNSLFYASTAMLFCVALGLAISYLTVRIRVFGGALLDGLAMLPLAVPGLVMAFGYVAMTLQWPFQSGWLHETFSVVGAEPNPVPLLIIAYAVRRLPYVVRSASAGLQQTSGELEEAAWTLGATRAMGVRRIVVPLIMANLIAGAILVFSFSMLEVSDSLILAQKESHYPITKAIYELFGRLGDGPYVASAMGVWGMALLSVTLIGASVLLGRKMGALFRV